MVSEKYGELPTTAAEPDNVLCIRNLDDNDDIVYIFDAKYRINTKGNIIGPMEEDINVMHRYRDSIVANMPKANQFKYETFGVYVMFPYSEDEDKFKENPFYKSIEKVNIGAFPMLPGKSSLIEAHIEKIVGQSKVEANKERVLQDEFDYYNRFENMDTIVAIVPGEDHYEVYKKHQFHHLPKGKNSDVFVGIKYLALYKVKSEFKENAGVDEYAKVKSIREYKRKECSELTESSRASGEDIYIRFELEEFKPLNKIKAMDLGIRNYWYTTLYLLKNATNIHQLKFKSNFDIDVYKKLHRIAEANGYNIKMRKNGYEVNGVIVVIEGKSITIGDKEYSLENLNEKCFNI